MYFFARNAGVDLTTYKEPSIEDRSGPPLSQGFLLTLVSMVGGALCSPEILDKLAAINPNAWYHGQLVEAVLDDAARHDADEPFQSPARINADMGADGGIGPGIVEVKASGIGLDLRPADPGRDGAVANDQAHDGGDVLPGAGSDLEGPHVPF